MGSRKARAGAMALAILAGPGLWAQSTVHLATQGRSADFSVYPQTKPARVVTALPLSCSAGEVAALTAGTVGLYFCTPAGSWIPVAAHTHAVTDLSGVTGKHGGGVLQAFDGGVSALGDCVEFDGSGNVRSTGRPCAVVLPNAGVTFAGQTMVTINHNQSTTNVLVSCYDSGGALVQPDRTLLTSGNQVVVYFTQPQSGSCVANTMNGGSSTNMVTYVFGRQGAITAQAGDYSFSQISGVAGLGQGGTNQSAWYAGRCVQVSADGARLESASAACGVGGGGGAVTSVFGRAGVVTAQAGDYTFSQVAGTAVLSQGGTSQTAWTAGRCVQVSSDGSKLESASAGCGTGGAGSLVLGAGLLGTGTTLDPLRADTAVLSTFVQGSGPVTVTVPANSQVEVAVTVTGAVVGDPVMTSAPTAIPVGLMWVAYVGSTNTVVLRLLNSTGANIDLTGSTFTFRLLKSF